MKVKVKNEFVDIHTNELHHIDEVMDVTNERLKEIQSVDAGLVEVIKTTRKADEKKGE